MAAETESIVRVLDFEVFLKHFLERVSATLGAEGSALRLNGTTPRLLTQGEWRGHAELSTELTYEGQLFGQWLIGPNERGRNYTPDETKASKSALLSSLTCSW